MGEARGGAPEATGGKMDATVSDTREVTALRRLHALMCRVNAGDDLASVLQTLVEGVADVTGFAVAAVSYLHPDQHLEVVAVAGDDAARDQLIGTRTPVDEIAAEFAIADDWGLLRFVPHERLNGEVARGWIPDVRPLDVPDAWHPEDALLAPLYAPTGEMVGLLSVDLPRDGRRPGRFAREALEMYVAQAGIAISNALQRERLREEVRLAATVRDVAHAAGNALELDRVGEAAVGPLARGLGCDAVWLRTFEVKGEPEGRVHAVVHPDSPVPFSPEAVALAGRVAERAWAARQAVVAPPDAAGPGLHMSEEEAALAAEFASTAGCSTLMLVPLGAGPECLGYLVLGRGDPSAPWSAEERAAALEIGRDLGQAFLHARLFEREHELVGELQQLDRYKTEMVSTLAHELKSPLTSIIGHLELLEDGAEAEVPAMSLGAIERGAGRLNDLVEDLLLLSKVGDPRRPVVREPVDVAAVAREVADLLAGHAARQEVQLELVGTDARVEVLGDEAELERMVVNLLGNAVKFSPPGTRARLEVEVDGEMLVLRFRDEGIGISAEDQGLLFTEFFRSTNPEALAVPGTGLGLTIVQRIVERHRGTVSVDSELGRGTTFTVILPL